MGQVKDHEKHEHLKLSPAEARQKRPCLRIVNLLNGLLLALGVIDAHSF